MNQQIKHKLFWIFLFIPFVKPAILAEYDELAILENLFNFWRLGACALLAFMYLWQMIRKKRKPSVMLVLMGLYLAIVGGSALLQTHYYFQTANYAVTIFGFCILIELSLRDDPAHTLDMIFYPMSVLVIINFILIIIFPNGLCSGGLFWYRYNFLGIDNRLAALLIPYMTITVLRSEIFYGDANYTAYVMVGIATISLFLVWSATAMIGAACFVFFLLFCYKRKLGAWFNGLTAMAAGFGLFFGVVILRLQNIFAFLIEGVFHKGLSFTGRTDIWDIAIDMIMKSPLIGYGYAQPAGKVYRLAKGKYYHAHNVFLEVLMEGGILAMIPFALMLAVIADQLMRWRKEPAASILGAGLVAMALITSMEQYLDSCGVLIYAMFFLSYHIGTLVSGKDTAPISSH